jgi:hypothetical protein
VAGGAAAASGGKEEAEADAADKLADKLGGASLNK